MIDNTAPWCNVDTRTGNLTCVLEENHCFDAEVYADELPEAEFLDFKEDQRSKYLSLVDGQDIVAMNLVLD